MRYITLISILCFLPAFIDGARILGIVAFSGKSHNHNFAALAQELAKRGHDVTVVTPYPIKNPPKNYHQIDVPEAIEKMNSMDQSQITQLSLIKKMQFIWTFMTEMCPMCLDNPDIKALLNEKFDLVISSMFFNECLLPFANYNKVPLILFSPAGLMSSVGDNLGNPEPLAYVPNIFLPFSPEMNFLERLINLILFYAMDAFRRLIYLPRMDAAAKQFFGKDISNILDCERNTSLTLICTHWSLNQVRPLQPNIIEVGGMHLDEKSEPLPKDLQEYIDGAKDGVIYFSMGSVLKPEQFPAGMVDTFIEVFKALPQRVIWKWNLDELPGQPKNVKLGKWLPQQAILAHPNVRLFITHGGLLSTQEAAHHGVPLVAIPVMGDQQLNVARAEQIGFAYGVSFHNITQASIQYAIRHVLNSPSYAEKAKILQKRVRDRPMTPLNRAAFWTEYVLRHNGAYHLQSAAKDLPWYQLYLFDIAALFLGCAVLLVLSLKYLIKMCCSKGESNKKTTPKKKQN